MRLLVLLASLATLAGCAEGSEAEDSAALPDPPPAPQQPVSPMSEEPEPITRCVIVSQQEVRHCVLFLLDCEGRQDYAMRCRKVVPGMPEEVPEPFANEGKAR